MNHFYGIGNLTKDPELRKIGIKYDSSSNPSFSEDQRKRLEERIKNEDVKNF